MAQKSSVGIAGIGQRMLRILIIVTTVAIATPLAAQSDADVERRYSKDYTRCMESSEGASTYGMQACIGKEYVKRDAELNSVYKRVMARLSPAKQKTLRQSQRQWIKRRDAIALEEAAEWEGGTGAPAAYNLALMQETVRRTIWLERYR
jgi:uncharacterized protein YecT (DUF1311 family)